LVLLKNTIVKSAMGRGGGGGSERAYIRKNAKKMKIMGQKEHSRVKEGYWDDGSGEGERGAQERVARE
jgi:hypothetical protein